MLYTIVKILKKCGTHVAFKSVEIARLYLSVRACITVLHSPERVLLLELDIMTYSCGFMTQSTLTLLHALSLAPHKEEIPFIRTKHQVTNK
jgi:hypothetical protein